MESSHSTIVIKALPKTLEATSPADHYSFHNCNALFEPMFSNAHKIKCYQLLIDKMYMIYTHLIQDPSALAKNNDQAASLINRYFSDFMYGVEQEINNKDEGDPNILFPINSPDYPHIKGKKFTHPSKNVVCTPQNIKRNKK